MSVQNTFIVPPPDAPPSGGNLYNEGLLAGLPALHPPVPCVRLTPAQLDASVLTETVWLDTLYLDQLPRVRALAPAGARVCLIAHALPSRLARAAGLSHAALEDAERARLTALDGALAPSSTMASVLRALAPALPVWTVEPAIQAIASSRSAVGPLSAFLIGNLTPNKGLLPLLRALDGALRASDDFTLTVLGGDHADPDYARACASVLAASPALAARVAMRGVQPFDQVLSALARGHVLVSASRDESFGMAIADARAAGCIVLARRGGHVAAQLRDAPDALFDDDASLAMALLRLARDPGERTRRLARAAQRRPAPRSWRDVAREFAAL